MMVGRVENRKVMECWLFVFDVDWVCVLKKGLGDGVVCEDFCHELEEQRDCLELDV